MAPYLIGRAHLLLHWLCALQHSTSALLIGRCVCTRTHVRCVSSMAPYLIGRAHLLLHRLSALPHALQLSQRPAHWALCCTRTARTVRFLYGAVPHWPRSSSPARAQRPAALIQRPALGAVFAHALRFQCVLPTAPSFSGRAHPFLHGLSALQLSVSALCAGRCVCTRTARTVRFLYGTVPHWTCSSSPAWAQRPAALSQRPAQWALCLHTHSLLVRFHYGAVPH